MDFGRITDPEAYKIAMANLLRTSKNIGTSLQNEADKNYGLLDYAVAPVEVPLSVASGAVAPFLGVGKGIYQNITQGTNNRVDNPELAQSFIYQPSSPVSQEIVGSLGSALEQSKLPAFTPMVGTVANKVPALLRSKTELPVAAPKLDKIGQALENRRINEFKSLFDEYKGLEEAKTGKIINTDIARELSPEYRANRTLSANVHEPASAFTKQYYAELLKQPVKENSYVLFTGGGTGAGKTSSLKQLPQLVDAADMVYDTNMNKLESSVKKIDQALDSGRKVAIAYTFRDPVEALEQGALSRAMNMKKKLGSGRTVPIEEHLKTHIGARDTIEQLMNKYKNNENVQFSIIDNSLGKDKARLTDIGRIPKLDQKVMQKRLMEALEEQYKAGKIDEDVYKGTKGENK